MRFNIEQSSNYNTVNLSKKVNTYVHTIQTKRIIIIKKENIIIKR